MAPEQRKGHRWFSSFWDWQVRHEPPSVRRVREEIAGGATGRILEIGCGNGANFEYYGDEATEVIATEPDLYMLERARRRAESLGRPIAVQEASALELPFEDGSFDCVVSTLNMCSIPEPAKALAEIRRVLKPDGGYRFADHVRYDNAFGGFAQDVITPLWSWIGAGCHPNRDIGRLMREAGFEFRSLDHFNPVPPVPPMIFSRPCIKGVAVPA